MNEYVARDSVLTVLDWDCASRDALNAIKAIPAADVVEVRHGRLLNPNPYGVCSVCGHLIDIRDSHNYCPSCGAKMDGGQDE